MKLAGLLGVTVALALAGCATGSPAPAKVAGPVMSTSVKAPRLGLDPDRQPQAFPSTYRPAMAPPVAIINATILTAAGPRIDGGVLVIRDGKIAAVGRDVAIPADAKVVDAHGRWLTPGIIDPHTHIGLNSSPGEAGGGSANEMGPSQAGVWIEHAIWPQDPMFERARDAGVTTIQVLPGSASTFNGRSVTLKNVPGLTPQAMKFPDAPYGLKMACGENPISAGPGGGGRPTTRAGEMQAFRSMFLNAADYSQRWQDYRHKLAAGLAGDPPKRDFALETVAAAMDGTIKIHIHCYRADDMLQMIDLSHEFGFKITAFHHALEAFKIAPTLAKEGIAVVTWAGDWSGYKMEAYDSIMENAAFVERAGGLVAMHSDDVMLMQHLNQEAARAMTAGREAGLGTTPEQAIRWVTLNPAKIIGVADRTGSLEVGKMADLVLWNTDPFSVYALTDQVYIDGVLMRDRAAPPTNPQSDFELGQVKRRPQ